MHLLTLLVALTCCAGLVVAVSWEDTGSGTRYTLRVEADVAIQNENNLDGSEYLHTGQYAESTRKRSLLLFEDIPTECRTVNWAKMYVYHARSYRPETFSPNISPDIARPIEVYQVHQPWIELLATRDKRSSYLNWTAPLLDLSGRDAGPQVLDTSTVSPGHPASFVEFDVSCALAQKLGHGANHGFLMRAQNEQVVGTDLWWYSRRHRDSNKHPFISVLCDSPRDPPAEDQSCRQVAPAPRTRAATNRAPVQRTPSGYDTYSQGPIQGQSGLPLGQAFPDVSNAAVCDDLISRCPSIYPVHGRLLPHPTNTARYCSCRFCDVQGVTMRDMPCPAGTVFSYNLQECTSQQDCGCN